MEYSVVRLSVASSDGIHNLSGVLYEPKGEVKGLFHIVHGMTEYIERYSHLMSFLADAGFAVFGYDNLGHGKTVSDKSELGFIAHKKGYDYLVRDVKVFEDEIIKRYPEKPLVLMGHSMGSFIARLAAVRFKQMYKALVVCGTGGPNPLGGAGLLICNVIKMFCGERHISPLVEKMAFGAYNKHFEGISKYDWLTKDRSRIEKYADDEYCTFHFTVSALYDLIKLNCLANQKKGYAVDKRLSVLLVSGDMDPVGNYGKGVKKVFEGYLKAGVLNTEIKLYENCRHEIHNDTCSEEMFRKIAEFAVNNTKI